MSAKYIKSILSEFQKLHLIPFNKVLLTAIPIVIFIVFADIDNCLAQTNQNEPSRHFAPIASALALFFLSWLISNSPQNLVEVILKFYVIVVDKAWDIFSKTPWVRSKSKSVPRVLSSLAQYIFWFFPLMSFIIGGIGYAAFLLYLVHHSIDIQWLGHNYTTHLERIDNYTDEVKWLIIAHFIVAAVIIFLLSIHIVKTKKKSIPFESEDQKDAPQYESYSKYKNKMWKGIHDEIKLKKLFLRNRQDFKIILQCVSYILIGITLTFYAILETGLAYFNFISNKYALVLIGLDGLWICVIAFSALLEELVVFWEKIPIVLWTLFMTTLAAFFLTIYQSSIVIVIILGIIFFIAMLVWHPNKNNKPEFRILLAPMLLYTLVLLTLQMPADLLSRARKAADQQNFQKAFRHYEEYFDQHYPQNGTQIFDEHYFTIVFEYLETSVKCANNVWQKSDPDNYIRCIGGDVSHEIIEKRLVFNDESIKSQDEIFNEILGILNKYSNAVSETNKKKIYDLFERLFIG